MADAPERLLNLIESTFYSLLPLTKDMYVQCVICSNSTFVGVVMELLASYGTRENILIEKKRCFDFDKCDFNATKVHQVVGNFE